VNEFLKAVETGLTKKPEVYKKPETAYGFPIDSNLPFELNEWFAKNPSTAGMVWGQGVNQSPKDAPMSIAINPYSEGMKNPKAREAVIRNEAARILMRDNPVKDFEITPQMKAWREKTFQEGHPYRSDDQAFRQTLVARMISEGGLGEPTPEVMSEMKRYSDELDKRK